MGAQYLSVVLVHRVHPRGDLDSGVFRFISIVPRTANALDVGNTARIRIKRHGKHRCSHEPSANIGKRRLRLEFSPQNVSCRYENISRGRRSWRHSMAGLEIHPWLCESATPWPQTSPSSRKYQGLRIERIVDHGDAMG